MAFLIFIFTCSHRLFQAGERLGDVLRVAFSVKSHKIDLSTQNTNKVKWTITLQTGHPVGIDKGRT
jgi:hypothetical protein